MCFDRTNLRSFSEEWHGYNSDSIPQNYELCRFFENWGGGGEQKLEVEHMTYPRFDPIIPSRFLMAIPWSTRRISKPKEMMEQRTNYH